MYRWDCFCGKYERLDSQALRIRILLQGKRTCHPKPPIVALSKRFANPYSLLSFAQQFMEMLQGKRIPVRVNLFLIVNPPRWFNKVWAMMRPMLSEEFSKKVHMIQESQLSEFLAPGFEAYLPDEMITGQAKTDTIVTDFVAYRLYREQHVQLLNHLQGEETTISRLPRHSNTVKVDAQGTMKGKEAERKRKWSISALSRKKLSATEVAA
jgi:CRAL/TRIO domain